MPIIAIYLIDLIESAGFQARLVGGIVRDIVLNSYSATDIDIATTMPARDLFEYLLHHDVKCIPTAIDYGTITAVFNGTPIEITTLRRDIKTDGRHAVIEYTNSWYEDSLRRDFTFNAVYCDKNGTLYDYHNGIQDLKNRVVTFIGDPEIRIKEDFLRILRYFRFVIQYGAATDENTLNIIRHLLFGLKNVSGERIYNELMKINLKKGIQLIMSEIFGVANCVPMKNSLGLSNEEILASFMAYYKLDISLLRPTNKFKKIYNNLCKTLNSSNYVQILLLFNHATRCQLLNCLSIFISDFELHNTEE